MKIFDKNKSKMSCLGGGDMAPYVRQNNEKMFAKNSKLNDYSTR